MAGNILDLDYSHFGHLLPKSFLRTLWGFVHKHNISVPRLHPELEHQREKDSLLMHKFSLEDSISNNDLKILNHTGMVTTIVNDHYYMIGLYRNNCTRPYGDCGGKVLKCAINRNVEFYKKLRG